MNQHERLLQAILGGRSDADIRVADLRSLMQDLGFEERKRGSHHLFSKAGIVEIFNLLSRGVHVRPYQVRQVRNIVLKYRMGRDV